MSALPYVLDGLWAGAFAAALALLLTAPAGYVFPTFVCGFIGRCLRDVGMAGGLGQDWATLIAAAFEVLVAAALIRGRHVSHVSPVVLICGVLPLGAAVAMFQLMFALLQTSTLKGAPLEQASVAFTANLSKVFTGSLAIALGLAAGLTLVELVRRESPPTRA